MNKVNLIDFTGGFSEEIRSDLLADNVCQVVENCEVNVNGLLDDRDELSSCGIAFPPYGEVVGIYLWNTYYKLKYHIADCKHYLVVSKLREKFRLYIWLLSDKWQICHICGVSIDVCRGHDESVLACNQCGGVQGNCHCGTEILNSPVSSGANPSIYDVGMEFVTKPSIAITDREIWVLDTHKPKDLKDKQPLRYIKVKKSEELETGVYDVFSPVKPLIVTAKEKQSDNISGTTALPYGSLLQYCYTYEDAEGKESKPSSISSYFAYQFLWDNLYTKEVVLTIPGFLSDNPLINSEINKIKKIRIYRRDAKYTESEEGFSSFYLVGSVDNPSVKNDLSDWKDIAQTNVIQLEEADYQIKGDEIIHLDDSMFVSGGIKDAEFSVDGGKLFKEIRINNTNGKGWINKVLCFEVDDDVMKEYLNSSSFTKCKFIDMDTRTELIAQKFNHINKLFVYVYLPYIYPRVYHSIYFFVDCDNDSISNNQILNRDGISIENMVRDINCNQCMGSEYIDISTKSDTEETVDKKNYRFGKVIDENTSLYEHIEEDIFVKELIGSNYTDKKIFVYSKTGNNSVEFSHNSCYFRNCSAYVCKQSTHHTHQRDGEYACEFDRFPDICANLNNANMCIRQNPNGGDISITNSDYNTGYVSFTCVAKKPYNSNNLNKTFDFMLSLFHHTTSRKYSLQIQSISNGLKISIINNSGSTTHTKTFDIDYSDITTHNIVVSWKYISSVTNSPTVSYIDFNIYVMYLNRNVDCETVSHYHRCNLTTNGVTVDSKLEGMSYKPTNKIGNIYIELGKTISVNNAFALHNPLIIPPSYNIGCVDGKNQNISIHDIDDSYRPGLGMLYFSNHKRQFLPQDYINTRSEILKMLPAPLFLESDHHNTILLFMKDRIDRVLLKKDTNGVLLDKRMIGNVYNQYVRYPNMAELVEGDAYFISAEGIMRFSQNGIHSLSQNVIDLKKLTDGRDVEKEGFIQYIPDKKQVWFCFGWNGSNTLCLVYDLRHGVFYKFLFGRRFSKGFFDGKNFFMGSDNTLLEYPRKSSAKGIGRVVTKKFKNSAKLKKILTKSKFGEMTVRGTIDLRREKIRVNKFTYSPNGVYILDSGFRGDLEFEFTQVEVLDGMELWISS